MAEAAGKDFAELVGVPVLLKAVDFLFALAKDRLGGKGNRNVGAATTDEAQESRDERELDRQRDAVQRRLVNRALLRLHEDEVASLLEQIEIHQRNLHLASQQKAKWGDALVPAIIVNTINDEERAIRSGSQRLSQVIELLTESPLPSAVVEPLRAKGVLADPSPEPGSAQPDAERP